MTSVAQKPASGCPIAHDFAPFSETYLADPYPLYARLRQDRPVAYAPEFSAYLVTRHSDIEQVLNDRDTYPSGNTQVPVIPVNAEAGAVLAGGFPRKAPFTGADPPHHPKMRNATARCLKPRRWDVVQQQLRTRVAAMLDAVLAQSPVDLASAVAAPTSLSAAFLLLGFPPEDMDRVRAWCGKRVALMFGVLSAEDQVHAAHNITDFWTYCRDFVRMRVAHPGDDLTTDLLELSKQRGDDLTVDDIDNIVYSIALAGHETTACAMLNGILRLMNQREDWDRLCRDPALIPGAVEELLRLDTPLVAVRRKVAVDTTLAGVPIPAGANVIVLLGAGNHDSRRFSDPARIDLGRPNAKEHLTFGQGWHFCIGAPLARFEFTLILEELTRRVPQMRLVRDQQLAYPQTLNIRGPERLLVEF